MSVKKMNCREVGRRLQTYLDGELTDDRIEAIKQHLDACSRCGLEADVFNQIKADLAGISPTPDAAALRRLREFTEQIAQNASSQTP
ncbi:MAG: zf-HC2 domain-containing protein [Acidimicrobiales bacterium]|nr:zf-HC2 domain-containing protein [Acidimicrobiia bacterium]NNC78538.1 zf-HC2 domain-containing protein [Acidimicrobiales bacterium]